MLNTSASGTRSLRLNIRSAARTGESVRRGGCFLQHKQSFQLEQMSTHSALHAAAAWDGSHGRQLARLIQH